jgi:hypothetical protein
MEFSVTRVLWSCATLGFSNSIGFTISAARRETWMKLVIFEYLVYWNIFGTKY